MSCHPIHVDNFILCWRTLVAAQPHFSQLNEKDVPSDTKAESMFTAMFPAVNVTNKLITLPMTLQGNTKTVDYDELQVFQSKVFQPSVAKPDGLMSPVCVIVVIVVMGDPPSTPWEPHESKPLNPRIPLPCDPHWPKTPLTLDPPPAPYPEIP